MPIQSKALIHLRAARPQGKLATQLNLKERIIDELKRLIPLANLLPGARSIFSVENINRVSVSELENLKRFFLCLQALDVRSKNDFIKLSIEGLDEPARDRPESKYADRLRYILENVFDCKFAYDQRDQLIIGRREEIEEGIRLKVFSYKPKMVLPVPLSQSRITKHKGEISTSTALVRMEDVKAITKKEIRSKEELKQVILDLLERGMPEAAAAVLFSSSERSIGDNLKLLEELLKSGRNYLLDGYEKLSAALQLQIELHDTKLFKSKNDAKTLLFAYLLGRYAADVPVLAARVIGKVAVSWHGRDFGFLVEMFALMEKKEYRANAMQGLTAIGEFKLVNHLFQIGLDEKHGPYHDRFGDTLDELRKRDGELFLNHTEFITRGRVTIYRREPEKVEIISVSPDKNLRATIRKLVRKGEEALAARIAFSGYYDISIRIESLIKLGFRRLGKLLDAAEEDKRIRVLMELAFGIQGEKQKRVAEEVALAMLWLGGKKDLDRSAAYYHQLVVGEASYPGARFAARKLLLLGLLEYQTTGDYGLLYDKLATDNPGIYSNDRSQFMATDGQISALDQVVGEVPQKIRQYYEILLDKNESCENRSFAVRMMADLKAGEYLGGLARLANNGTGSDELDDAIYGAIAKIYGGMDLREAQQRAICKKFDRAIDHKNRHADDSGASADTYGLTGIYTYHTNSTEWQVLRALIDRYLEEPTAFGAEIFPLLIRAMAIRELSGSASEALNRANHPEIAYHFLMRAIYLDREIDFSALNNYDIKNIGKDLWNMEQNKRIEILVAITRKLKNKELLRYREGITRILRCSKPGGKLVGVVNTINAMVGGQPEENQAARKLLMTGLLDFRLHQYFIFIYNELRGKYPEIYQNDWEGILASDGIIKESDKNLGLREAAITKYYSMFADEKQSYAARAFAAEMLGALQAQFQFKGLVKIVGESQAWRGEAALMAIVKIYGGFNIGEEIGRVRQKAFDDKIMIHTSSDDYSDCDGLHVTYIKGPSVEKDSMEMGIVKMIMSYAENLFSFGEKAIPILLTAMNNGEIEDNYRQLAARLLAKMDIPALGYHLLMRAAHFRRKTDYRALDEYSENKLGSDLREMGAERRAETVIAVMEKGLGQLRQEMRFKLAKSFILNADDKDLEGAGEMIHEMITGNMLQPEAGVAAARLIYMGALANPFVREDYENIYYALRRKYPEIYRLNWSEFYESEGSL